MSAKFNLVNGVVRQIMKGEKLLVNAVSGDGRVNGAYSVSPMGVFYHRADGPVICVVDGNDKDTSFFDLAQIFCSLVPEQGLSDLLRDSAPPTVRDVRRTMYESLFA